MKPTIQATAIHINLFVQILLLKFPTTWFLNSGSLPLVGWDGDGGGGETVRFIDIYNCPSILRSPVLSPLWSFGAVSCAYITDFWVYNIITVQRLPQNLIYAIIMLCKQGRNYFKYHWHHFRQLNWQLWSLQWWSPTDNCSAVMISSPTDRPTKSSLIQLARPSFGRTFTPQSSWSQSSSSSNIWQSHIFFATLATSLWYW